MDQNFLQNFLQNMLPSQTELIALLQQTQAEHQAIKDELQNLTATYNNNTNDQLQQAKQEARTLRAWNEDLQRQLFGTEAGTDPSTFNANDPARDPASQGFEFNADMSMPKYKGRNPHELPGVECVNAECPWLHQVQARGISDEVIMGLPHDPMEAKKRNARALEMKIGAEKGTLKAFKITR
jgi:hypothetical protein